MTDIDDIDETEIDDVQLRMMELAEIFIRFNISPMQALEYIEEHYPVIHVELLSDPDTLH